MTAIYLQGKGDKEPDVAEFISALAAGNNAQLMVMAPSAPAATDRSMLLSLVAAAHQSGGRVISVSRDSEELETRKRSLGPYSQYVEFVIGEASTLLRTGLKDGDFVLVDCKSSGYESVLRASRMGLKALVVGYNALDVGRNSNSSTWFSNGFKTHFLPIGGGLMVSRSSEQGSKSQKDGNCREKKKSCWVVRVDELTGEEHAYRIVSPRANKQTMIQA